MDNNAFSEQFAALENAQRSLQETHSNDVKRLSMNHQKLAGRVTRLETEIGFAQAKYRTFDDRLALQQNSHLSFEDKLSRLQVENATSANKVAHLQLENESLASRIRRLEMKENDRHQWTQTAAAMAPNGVGGAPPEIHLVKIAQALSEPPGYRGHRITQKAWIATDIHVLRQVGLNDPNYEPWRQAFLHAYGVGFDVVKTRIELAPEHVIASLNAHADVTMLEPWRDVEPTIAEDILEQCRMIFYSWLNLPPYGPIVYDADRMLQAFDEICDLHVVCGMPRPMLAT